MIQNRDDIYLHILMLIGPYTPRDDYTYAKKFKEARRQLVRGGLIVKRGRYVDFLHWQETHRP